MSKCITFDIEVAFYSDLTKAAQKRLLDEKNFANTRFGSVIDASSRYVTHISYKIDNQKVVDLSLLDGKCSLEGDGNERDMLIKFTKAHNSCNESVAHFGKKFDMRFLNARIAKYGLERLRPIRLHDTWRIGKDNFLLPNNKLDTYIRYFGCPYGKPSLGWDVWQRVSLGEEKAHKTLRHRCRYDVLSLAWLWKNIFSKFANRPNQALAKEKMYIDDVAIRAKLKSSRCPECMKKATITRQGYNYSKTKITMAFKCRECGDWSSAPIHKNGNIGRIR